MNNKIWYVIVSYKPQAEMLKSLLDTLPKNSTIVIDNTKNNLGFGGGANKGIIEALEKGAEWVVILNQDLQFSIKSINDFEKNLLNLKPDIVGPFVGNLDKKRWTTILPAQMKRIDYISGAFIAIHKEVFAKVGFFYEPYFMYYEDVDYCVRAKKLGFSLKKIPIDGIIHNEAYSLKKGSFLHEYYLARNHLLFVQRLATMSIKLHEIFRLPKTIYEKIIRRNQGGLTGIKDYFLRRFGVYRRKL